METHKAFTTCASQYSWNTVLETNSNAKEIWSRHGIQAWTSVSCFDHSCTKLLGNLGSPWPLRGLQFMHYSFLTEEQRGLWLLLKPWRFSPPSVMFYFKLPYGPLYIKWIHFPALRGQCKKLKHGAFAWLNPRHVRGLGAWLKPTGILYLLDESSLAAESWCLRYKYQARSWGIW